MNTAGTHLIADLWMEPANTPSPQRILDVMREALAISRMTVLTEHRHDFTPQGMTAVWLLAESHASVHTYPEAGYIAIDLFTCGDEGDPQAAYNHIRTHLVDAPLLATLRIMPRGINPTA